jgi:hypothetical protein
MKKPTPKSVWQFMWRVILLVLFAFALMQVNKYQKLTASVAPEFEGAEELAKAQCPTGERNDWRFDPNILWANRFEWRQVSVKKFQEKCSPRCTGLRNETCTAACAWIYPDPIYGGRYGVIYSLVPRFALPEYIQTHEICHLRGWVHE